jgi:hypothetical protein
MTDKPKTIQEALAEVQRKINEERAKKAAEMYASMDEAAPEITVGGKKVNTKAVTPKNKAQDYIANKEGTKIPPAENQNLPGPAPQKPKSATVSDLTKSAGTTAKTLGKIGGIGAAASMGGSAALGGAALGGMASGALGALATQTQTGRDVGKWIGDNVPGAKTAADLMRKAGETIGVREPSQPKAAETPKAETPKTAEAPKQQTTPPAGSSAAKMSFNQAYAKARELAKTAGQDPNKAQFKFDRGGGEKIYQAAATKKDYVPMSKQFKVDVGAPKAAATPSTTPKTAEAPKTETPKAAEAPKAPESLGKTVGSLLRGDLSRAGEGAKEWGSAVSTSVDRVRKNTANALDPKGAESESGYSKKGKSKMSEENEINELSPFERTFAQKMKQLGPGKTYRDPHSGKDILLKYADNKPHASGNKPHNTSNVPTPPKRPDEFKSNIVPAPKQSTWRDPAKIDYSKDNKAKPETLPSTVRGSAADPARDAARDTGITGKPGGETGVYSRDGSTHSLQGKNITVPTTNRTPEYESGGKKKKMSEETNPLIAAFLKLQDENPANMFEAAKKAKKDWDGDKRIESEKNEVWGSRFAAAKRAGKMEEAALDPKDSDVTAASKTITKTKPAEDPSLPKTYPGTASTVKGPNPTSDLFKNRIAKEEVELDENSFYASNVGGRVKMHKPGTMLKHEKHGTVSVVSSDPGHKDFDASSDRNPKGMKGPSYKVKDGKGQTHHIDLESDWGLSDKPVKAKRINVKEEETLFSEAELEHINSFFLEASVAPVDPETTEAKPTSEKLSQKDLTVTAESGKKKVKEEVEQIEEGRPKKNPTPETTERDPRKHIQVEAGRAAAGNVVDFTHNDGSKSKITPAMGRKITSHLQGLKPADRQAAVNKMHDSAEGLKV